MIWPDSSEAGLAWLLVETIIEHVAPEIDDTDLVIDGKVWHCVTGRDHDDAFFPWLAFTDDDEVVVYQRFGWGRGFHQTWIEPRIGDEPWTS